MTKLSISVLAKVASPLVLGACAASVVLAAEPAEAIIYQVNLDFCGPYLSGGVQPGDPVPADISCGPGVGPANLFGTFSFDGTNYTPIDLVLTYPGGTGPVPDSFWTQGNIVTEIIGPDANLPGGITFGNNFNESFSLFGPLTLTNLPGDSIVFPGPLSQDPPYDGQAVNCNSGAGQGCPPPQLATYSVNVQGSIVGVPSQLSFFALGPLAAILRKYRRKALATQS